MLDSSHNKSTRTRCVKLDINSEYSNLELSIVSDKMSYINQISTKLSGTTGKNSVLLTVQDFSQRLVSLASARVFHLAEPTDMVQNSTCPGNVRASKLQNYTVHLIKTLMLENFLLL
jgi:hypothetical protein